MAKGRVQHMTKRNRKVPNRIIGFRKQLREMVNRMAAALEDFDDDAVDSQPISSLLAFVDEKALEYLETK